MKLCFEPEFVERSVFLAARRAASTGDTGLEQALHERIDSLYGRTDTRSREAAFREAYVAVFSSNGLGASLQRLIDEQPLIVKHVARGVIRTAIRKREETAELFVKPAADDPDRTLVIALRAETLLDDERLARTFRHELQHVADMLDEQFAYDPADWPAESSPAQANLLRDRFVVLWDCYIDGRLARRGHVDAGMQAFRASQFAKVFPLPENSENGNNNTFARVWRGEQLTYGDLVHWARVPETQPPPGRL